MYTRKLSFNERFFLATDLVTPPFCNQMIFEGSGSLDIEQWKFAVETASEANPGSRVVLRGFLSCSKWIDSGITPCLRIVDGSTWDGMSDKNAPFLNERLDPRKGPTCEIVIIQGEIPRVAFRTHHAVMDGRGTLHWAEDIFRVLRGEEPIGSDSTLTDIELAETFQTEGRLPANPEYIAPTGNASSDGSGVTWMRKRLAGRFNNLLPRISILIANEARKHREGKIRLTIPVDLRSRIAGINSTGNLTNTIYIEVPIDSTIESVKKDISTQLDNFCDCRYYHREKIMSYLPVNFIAGELKKIKAVKHAEGLYHNSGIISNLGIMDLKKFSGGGFYSKSWFSVPPCQEMLPFFMVLAGSENYVEMTAGMPEVLAGNGRLESFMDKIISGLKLR